MEDNKLNLNISNFTNNARFNVTNSSYTAMEDFLEIGKTYYKLENINTLRTGFLGHVLNSTAHVFSHGVYQKNFYYGEYFPNTAKLAQSVFSFAKNINYDVNLARPSKLNVTLLIKKNDIIEYGEQQKDGSIIFNISKDNPFTVKSYPFLLEYDVKVVANKSDEGLDYALTAYYDIDPNYTLPFSNTKNPYIKIWTESRDGKSYVYLSLLVWQMNKEITNFQVFSNDVSDNLMYDVTFQNQLSFFNVFYTYPKNQPRRYLPKYFNNIFTPEDSTEFCYYNYPSDTTLQIMFSGFAGTFRPRFNSNLDVEYYTTLGTGGNFAYKETAEIGFRFLESRLSKVEVLVAAISDATGGKDRETLKEIKQSVIRENFYRGNLSTDIDLTNYFATIMKDSINNSELKFFKKRDDVLRRIYSAFLLLKNSKGQTIPTNTINIEVDAETINSNDYKFKAGSLVVYDRELKVYRFLREDEFPSTVERGSGNNHLVLYNLPYLMMVHIDPVPRITYYRNSISRNMSMMFKNLNFRSQYEFIINSVSIQRNSLLGEEYDFSFILNTNMSHKSVEDNIKIVGILRKENSVYGYMNFELDNIISTENIVEYHYSAKLTTEDEFTNDGQIIITSGIKDMNTSSSSFKTYLDEDLTLELGVLTNGVESKYKFDGFNIPEYSNYTTLCSMTTSEEFSLAQSLDLLMQSDITIAEVGVVGFKNVPVVAHQYFSQYDYFEEFYELIDNYYTLISNNLDRLQNNTTIDLKFFNSFGISELYSSDTTNLRIHLRIRLFNNSNLNYIDNEIKKEIINYTDECNNEKLFSISNLNSRLETKFSEINMIEFVSLNDMNMQRIEEIEELSVFNKKTREQVINYVPEHLNIGIDYSDQDEYRDIKAMITIDYI